MEYDQSLMAMLELSNPGWLRLLSAQCHEDHTDLKLCYLVNCVPVT